MFIEVFMSMIRLIVITLAILFTTSNLFAQEYDDMYFRKSDRVVKEVTYQPVAYSARNQNPEYTSRNSTTTKSVTVSTTYYMSNYRPQSVSIYYIPYSHYNYWTYNTWGYGWSYNYNYWNPYYFNDWNYYRYGYYHPYNAWNYNSYYSYNQPQTVYIQKVDNHTTYGKRTSRSSTTVNKSTSSRSDRNYNRDTGGRTSYDNGRSTSQPTRSTYTPSRTNTQPSRSYTPAPQQNRSSIPTSRPTSSQPNRSSTGSRSSRGNN